MLQYIDLFEVREEIFSDHLPLCTRLCLGEKDSRRGVVPLLPKLKWDESKKDSYQEKVTSCIETIYMPLEESNMEMIDFINVIRNSVNTNARRYHIQNRFNSEWFDEECLTERRRVFKLLNAYRKTGSNTIRQQYLEVNRRYKKLCMDKQEKFYRGWIESMNSVRDSRDFWTLVRQYKRKKFMIGEILNMEEWVVHFSRLLNPDISDVIYPYAQPYVHDEILDSPFTMEELLKVLDKTKNNKAPGEDRISYEFYKNAPTVLLDKLILAYNAIYESGTLPDNFKTSIVFPVHKKGDINIVSNYRGISFNNCIGKIFAALLLKRLESWLNERKIIGEFQAGFRKDYSTVDNVFNLMSIIKIKLSVKRQKVYAFFVDLSAAFDRIDRQALIYKLSTIGLSCKMLSTLENYYTGTTSKVWSSEGLSQAFDTHTGVKQGCVLSPILFSLFLNDIESYVEGGIKVGGRNIKLLAYADDIVLLASDRWSLQKMIDGFDYYCSMWKLSVNLEKSKIIIFRNGGRPGRNENWRFRNIKIEVVNQYKYLGIDLTSGLSMEQHLKRTSAVAKNALGAFDKILLNKYISFPSKLKIFNAASRAIMCYGAQVWGGRMYSRVEQLQKYFIKRTFGLPQNTPDHSLYLETGLSPMVIYTLRLHLKYVQRCLRLSEDRYPNLLMKEIIKRRIFIHEEWELLSTQCSIAVEDFFKEHGSIENLIKSVSDKLTEGFKVRRDSSLRRILYPRLKTFTGHVYANCNSTLISWLIKARTEIMYLNKYVNDTAWCSLCNLKEEEDVIHFIARCPVLREIRLRYFGAITLTESELIERLNGERWMDVGCYCKHAWRYRYSLIQEFNY
jgi:hypothetical protein